MLCNVIGIKNKINKCCCIAHQVLRICASRRTGDENFITCMRHTLAGRYGDKTLGMGGVFVIEKGKAKIHIMVTIYNSANY